VREKVESEVLAEAGSLFLRRSIVHNIAEEVVAVSFLDPLKSEILDLLYEGGVTCRLSTLEESVCLEIVVVLVEPHPEWRVLPRFILIEKLRRRRDTDSSTCILLATYLLAVLVRLHG